jgi:hypothetical protein
MSLKDKVYAFAGEICLDDEGLVTLPSVFLQPTNLEATLTKQVVIRRKGRLWRGLDPGSDNR